MDTIFALASAPGKAGVSVIRISGHGAYEVAQSLTEKELPRRGMSLRTLRDSSGERLDEALVLTFNGPDSFTGENVVELQVHGSVAVVNSVMSTLAELDKARLAEPGEFTRRALENGKMDLAQVEGLADLIDAETEAQRRQAQTILKGELGQLAERWRRDLIRAASLLEAVIDFADEDVPTDVTPEVNELLDAVITDLSGQISGVKIAERIRTGFEVAIVGRPNVGKSTLLNALAGRDAAITSEYAGTTRDVIEVRMDLAGLPVTLLDTAGIRETEDAIENMGIALARKRALAADLRVFLLEETSDEPEFEPEAQDVIILAKGDLRADDVPSISGKSGKGIDQLVDQISSSLLKRSAGAGIATRERHKEAMLLAYRALVEAKKILERGEDLYDIGAEEIRTAIRALESLVGRIDVENLLDEIFSSFCLGK
ncbi:tRNA uridine-5-carboxymethylaminomethyl(34) synthesis GTPase MnmE [Falsiruegeria mediterranea]|uniref:tRNA modification GTPase MnmE n=1 Tax=Falsiruegeria mediterranea M17 TaxID=1200281 RepID=A0A2R8C3R9_9RHOB|nr:tRNA uridine-5-carboxymethylaminomethyl(34) synthesis GTPase MnmE [Falsiruegeria mediterranea]SPJ27016.1 tRNA modification GTPase MnmE [Falsiruegeria mediterranea M17]